MKYMKRCYELAISAGKKGYDTFGAVLVYNGEILENSVVYTSCAPCERCLAAIASLGVHQIVCGVSYKEFCRLLPFDYQAVDREGVLKQLGIQMILKESVLEEEGMHVFEWWGGEYHPLEELIAEMDEVKSKEK